MREWTNQNQQASSLMSANRRTHKGNTYHIHLKFTKRKIIHSFSDSKIIKFP